MIRTPVQSNREDAEFATLAEVRRLHCHRLQQTIGFVAPVVYDQAFSAARRYKTSCLHSRNEVSGKTGVVQAMLIQQVGIEAHAVAVAVIVCTARCVDRGSVREGPRHDHWR